MEPSSEVGSGRLKYNTLNFHSLVQGLTIGLMEPDQACCDPLKPN